MFFFLQIRYPLSRIIFFFKSSKDLGSWLQSRVLLDFFFSHSLRCYKETNNFFLFFRKSCLLSLEFQVPVAHFGVQSSRKDLWCCLVGTDQVTGEHNRKWLHSLMDRADRIARARAGWARSIGDSRGLATGGEGGKAGTGSIPDGDVSGVQVLGAVLRVSSTRQSGSDWGRGKEVRGRGSGPWPLMHSGL